MGIEDLLDWASDPIEALIERTATWLFAPAPRSAKQVVPDLAGLSGDEARATLARSGLRMRVRAADSGHSPAAAAIVVSQSPPAGASVRAGSVVTIRSGGTAAGAAPGSTQ